MPIDVVILAGGSIPKELLPSVTVTERALIEVAGQSMLHRVLDTLQDGQLFRKRVVVTTPLALAALPANCTGVNAGDGMVANLMAGLATVTSDQVLIVTGDVPLVTADTWAAFLEGAAKRDLQAAYPIVTRASVERQMPGGKRTYATLVDGTFTGGNAFLVPRARIGDLQQLIDTAYSARKNPLRLARLLGPGFILKAITKRLTVAAVEAKMSKLLGCKGGAVIMEDASIAFDVDKAADLELANKSLQPRGTLTS